MNNLRFSFVAFYIPLLCMEKGTQINVNIYYTIIDHSIIRLAAVL